MKFVLHRQECVEIRSFLFEEPVMYFKTYLPEITSTSCLVGFCGAWIFGGLLPIPLVATLMFAGVLIPVTCVALSMIK